MDWPTFLALLTVMVGLYTAVTTRQHATGEIFKAALDAAKEALEIRDRDIDKLNLETTKAQKRIDDLVQYTSYLSAWVRANYPGTTQPLSIDEYLKSLGG